MSGFFFFLGVKMRDLRFVRVLCVCKVIAYCLGFFFQLDVVLETNKSAIKVLEAVQKRLSQ